MASASYDMLRFLNLEQARWQHSRQGPRIMIHRCVISDRKRHFGEDASNPVLCDAESPSRSVFVMKLPSTLLLEWETKKRARVNKNTANAVSVEVQLERWPYCQQSARPRPFEICQDCPHGPTTSRAGDQQQPLPSPTKARLRPASCRC